MGILRGEWGGGYGDIERGMGRGYGDIERGMGRGEWEGVWGY